MPKLDALIFDVDGTLADTEKEGHRVAFNLAFQDAGLDWHWSAELYGQLLTVTGGKERIRYFIDHYRPDFNPPQDLDAFIAELHAAKTEHYKRLMQDPGLPLRPGVERLLKEARQAGLRLAIATTTTLDNVIALLQNSLSPDALDWFEVIAAGDVVPAKKPAPDIYIWAMQKMAVQPQQCLAFEDSEHGLRAALDAGIRAVLITVNDYTAQQNFNGATAVIDQLGTADQPLQQLAGAVPLADQIHLADLIKLHEYAWQ